MRSARDVKLKLYPAGGRIQLYTRAPRACRRSERESGEEKEPFLGFAVALRRDWARDSISLLLARGGGHSNDVSRQ